MNINLLDAVSFGNGLIKQTMPAVKVRMSGDLELYFVGLPLYLELVYRSVTQRELKEERGKPLFDRKFEDMLSDVTITQTESFNLTSYFRFGTAIKNNKADISFQQIVARLYINGFGREFFTPEEAHHVAGKVSQTDLLCRLDQPIIIFYRFPGSPCIYCIWIRRDKKNRLHIHDVDTNCFAVPSSVIVFTKDNVCHQEIEALQVVS